MQLSFFRFCWSGLKENKIISFENIYKTYYSISDKNLNVSDIYYNFNCLQFLFCFLDLMGQPNQFSNLDRDANLDKNANIAIPMGLA